jgi:hypothetical protein
MSHSQLPCAQPLRLLELAARTRTNVTVVTTLTTVLGEGGHRNRGDALAQALEVGGVGRVAGRASVAVDQVVELERVAVEVVELVLGGRAACGVDVGRVLQPLLAHAAHVVGRRDGVAQERARGVVVEVNGPRRHRPTAPGGEHRRGRPAPAPPPRARRRPRRAPG